MVLSTRSGRYAAPGTAGALVVLGAMGDLAIRHLVPALALLLRQGDLPPALRIVGFGLEPVSTQDYRTASMTSLEQNAPELDDADRAALVRRLEYRCADLSRDPDPSATLPAGPLIAYLALPPGVYAPAVSWLKAAGVAPGSRIVIEKPFGVDLASARELTRQLHTVVEERDVFRVDHFLYHQSVQDLLALRFGGSVFEPLWHREHVESVEITWEETADLAGRAGFYDRSGALRDMVQSHLLQLLALVAMERPATLTEGDLRDEKVAVLRQIPSLDPAQVEAQTARGRYATGAPSLVERGYADELGVEPSRNTETYACVRLQVDSPRWHGVPFVLRTGKALGRPRRRVCIRFRPHRGSVSSGESQVLRLEMAPDRLALQVPASGPDGLPGMTSVLMEATRARQPLPASARMLRDVMAGRSTFMVRDDEVEECWRIVDAVLDTWRTGVPPLQEYVAGSTGPLCH